MTSMLFLAAADASIFSPESITLVAGIVLIVVGLVGGGIEIREIKLPILPMVPRIASLLTGCVLTGLVLFHPSIFDLNPANAHQGKELGAAIPRLIEVKDVKKVLSQLGYYAGAFNNDPDDAYFQAVANFQHSKGIVQDGLVGGETYGKLREAAPWYFGDKQQVGDAKSQAQSH